MLIDGPRLAKWRKSRGFTQEDFANNFPFSMRTLQRFEDPNIDTYLSFSELDKITSFLKIYSYQLWKQLPPRQLIYGKKIISAQKFAEFFKTSINYRSNLSTIYTPDDPEIEQAILKLDEIFNRQQNYLIDLNNKTENEKESDVLKANIELRNLFRTITSKYKTDQASVFIFIYGKAIQRGDNYFEWESKWDIQINKSNIEKTGRWFDTTNDVIHTQVSENEYLYRFECQDTHNIGSKSNEEIDIELQNYIDAVLNCRSHPSIKEMIKDQVPDFNEFIEDEMDNK